MTRPALYDRDGKPILRGRELYASLRAQHDAGLDWLVSSAIELWLDSPEGEATHSVQLLELMRMISLIDARIPTKDSELWWSEYRACVTHARAFLKRHGWVKNWSSRGLTASGKRWPSYERPPHRRAPANHRYRPRRAMQPVGLHTSAQSDQRTRCGAEKVEADAGVPM